MLSEAKIANVTKKIEKVLNREIDRAEIERIMVGWEKSYKISSDHMFDDLNDGEIFMKQEISGLESGISALECRIRVGISTDSTGEVLLKLSEIKDYLKNYLECCYGHLNLISVLKKNIPNNKDNLDNAMRFIFSEGEKLGFKVAGERGDGRGNKKSILDYAILVTGIKNRKKLDLCFGHYIKNKPIFEKNPAAISVRNAKNFIPAKELLLV
jgi:hypothetical protein